MQRNTKEKAKFLNSLHLRFNVSSDSSIGFTRYSKEGTGLTLTLNLFSQFRNVSKIR